MSIFFGWQRQFKEFIKLRPEIKVIKISIAFAFLYACSNSHYQVPVRDFQQPPSKKINTHTVAQGETLYSIAWRYNLDYKKLAVANRLDTSYTIYPGQSLSLDTTKVAVAEPQVKTTQPAAPVLVKPTIKNDRSINKTNTVAPKPAIELKLTPKNWSWPSDGKIITTFSSNQGLNKGIDLDGDLGEPVRAAADGTVVYSGDGLRGYGKLIIVKHSDKYLSAYAHNRRLLVREGDTVHMGQHIAEMGSSGTDRVKLHFEIRYDGQPVNPMNYLPKR